MKTLAKLPEELFVAAYGVDGVVYGAVSGPYVRRSFAADAVRRRNGVARRRGNPESWRVLRASLVWQEDAR